MAPVLVPRLDASQDSPRGMQWSRLLTIPNAECYRERMEGVARYLRERGISVSEAELQALVREAFERTAGRSPGADPEHELPDGERAALARGGFEPRRPALGAEDPVLRGALEWSALVADALSARQAAAALGVNPSRIRQRLTSRPPTLYGVKHRGEWALPRFQFEGAVELPGLGEVVARLDPELSPVAVARWFLSPNPDLRVDEDEERALCPREWLLAGRPPREVARLAEGL